MRQELKKDANGILRFVPSQGPPSSVNVQLLNPDGTELAAEVAASDPHTLSTTLTTQADRGARTLSVDDESGTVLDEPIWVGGTDKPLEMHWVREHDSGLIVLYKPLKYDHVSGADVKAAVVEHAVAAANLDTLGVLYQARWEHDQSLVPRLTGTQETYTYFDVVARPFDLELNSLDLDETMPGAVVNAARNLPVPVLLRMASDEVRRFIEGVGLQAQYVRDGGQLAWLGSLLCAERILKRPAMQSERDAEALTAVMEWRDREWQRLLVAGLAWYDVDADGSVDIDETGVHRRQLRQPATYFDFARRET